jgi:hypothetical protein
MLFSRLFVAVAITSQISTLGFAHEGATVGEIRTEELKLTYIDHVLSGAIGSNPVYAYPLPDQFGLTINYHSGSEMISTEFKNSEYGLGGKFSRKDAEGKLVETSVSITKVDAKAAKIFGTVDADQFEVQISANEMNGHHFVNPHFKMLVGEKTYEFDLNNGQACMGCSTKLSYVIIGLLRVNGAL